MTKMKMAGKAAREKGGIISKQLLKQMSMKRNLILLTAVLLCLPVGLKAQPVRG